MRFEGSTLKARISASVEKPLRDMLYDHVKNKYDGLKGGLSMEVESALTSYLEGQTRTNAHKIFAPGTPRIERIVTQIIREINESTGFNKSFSLTTFELACGKIAGSDKRTVQKYLRWAEKLGFVKHHAGAIWDFVIKDKSEASS